jgi:DNA mismatch repair protein MutL
MQTENHNPIRILENSVIDSIAAGEVVDRPAHMIKELCENSLDAGATEITVEIKNGGRDVVIRDNGRGIWPEELPLALARHGTSKISKVDDLWQIESYGFRGEALASIGAVSELTVTSRVKNQSLGYCISNLFGAVSSVVETGADYGTTIEVQNLFQNVPARLKFLKTDSGEVVAIKNQMKALALANPDVSFRVLQEGELIYYWPHTSDLLKRVEQVLEKSPLYQGEAHLEGFHCRAVVSSPNETVGNSRQIWLFVRGRHVQDRSLQAAVLEAYRNLLMHGEYPTAAIFVDCPPDELDVNVSPTKSQVKFREAGVAFRVVQRAVRGVLETAPWVQTMIQTPYSTSLFAEKAEAPRLEDIRPQTMASGSSTRSLGGGASPSSSRPSAGTPNMSFQSTDFLRTQYPAKESGPVFSIAEVKEALGKIELWGSLEVLGQAHLTYIIAQKPDGILFIDQHAAHERVMFEKLMANFKSGAVEVQNYLLPTVVQMSEDLIKVLLDSKSELEKMGLYLDAFGPNEIAVQGAPALIKPEAVERMLHGLAQDYSQNGASFRIEKMIADIISTMACHSAVRAGQALSLSEMTALLKQMDEYPLSSFCPHGRPVFVEYSIRQLERDFGRIN